MHPILFVVPVPNWTVHLMLPLLILAGTAGLAAVGAARAGRREALRPATAIAIGALVLAVFLRNATYTLTPVVIQSYGALLGIALVVGYRVASASAAGAGYDRERVASCSMLAALGALAGARMGYVLVNIGQFEGVFDALALERGGLSGYGALLGAYLATWWYLRRHAWDCLSFADAVAPALAFTIALTRLGCYLFGCDFGSRLPKGAPAWLARLGTFPRWHGSFLLLGSGSPAWLEHVLHAGLTADSAASLPVHPTQIYEALGAAALVVIALAVRKNRSFPGQVWFATAFGYGALRFAIESVRGDPERGIIGPPLPLRTFLLLGWLAIAAAWALGPALSLQRVPVRRAINVLWCLPVIACLVGPVSRSLEHAGKMRVSISQWFALGIALAAAYYWRTRCFDTDVRDVSPSAKW